MPAGSGLGNLSHTSRDVLSTTQRSLTLNLLFPPTTFPYRTPCVTLKETIDGRPPKFDLDSPVDGSCQDALQELTVAYVSAQTNHADFTYEGNEHGCNEFCRSLSGYSDQVAMMTEEPLSSPTSVDKCVCIYQDGMVPSADTLPEYATGSPPKFYLTNPTDRSTLGLSTGYDCAEDEISIETQDRVNSVRQQFQLSYDQQIVSVACPNKVIEANCASDGKIVLGNLHQEVSQLLLIRSSVVSQFPSISHYSLTYLALNFLSHTLQHNSSTAV